MNKKKFQTRDEKVAALKGQKIAEKADKDLLKALQSPEGIKNVVGGIYQRIDGLAKGISNELNDIKSISMGHGNRLQDLSQNDQTLDQRIKKLEEQISLIIDIVTEDEKDAEEEIEDETTEKESDNEAGDPADGSEDLSSSHPDPEKP